jgi:hypothetical protein
MRDINISHLPPNNKFAQEYLQKNRHKNNEQALEEWREKGNFEISKAHRRLQAKGSGDQAKDQKRGKFVGNNIEPARGIEPRTSSLQKKCSTN